MSADRRLTTAEFALIAVDGIILLDLHPQIGIPQSDPVSSSRPKHRGILLSQLSAAEPTCGMGLTTSRSISGALASSTLACTLWPYLPSLTLCRTSFLSRSSYRPDASALPPDNSFCPPTWTRDTVLRSPGSKRTAVPAAMSRCVPQARIRSKMREGLVSVKR